MTTRGATRRPVVLHVVDSLYTGGLERLIELLVEQGSDMFDHRICALRAIGDVGERMRANATPIDLLGRSEGPDRTVVARLARYIARLRPDVVHAHSDGASDALPAARLARVRSTVFTEHGWPAPVIPPRARWRRRIYLRAAQRVVAVSDHLAARLRGELWVAPERIRVIRNAVPALAPPTAEERAAQRARLNVADSTFLVGAVGALRPVKCFPRLVEAVALVAQRRPDVKLLLVGDGPERSTIEAEIHRRGVGGVVMLAGHCEHVRDCLVALDLYATASEMEGTSLALLEACWCALPVVATAVGGNPEVVDDGISGTLVPPADPTALAGALERYAADPTRGRAHGERGRQRVLRHYSFADFAASHERLYGELCTP